MISHTTIRKRLFSIIAPSDKTNRASTIYDVFMLFCILISIVPLFTKSQATVFTVFEITSSCIFIVDYVFRLCTADLKLHKGIRSYFIYPFTFWGIVDLLSILPSIGLLHPSFRLLRLFSALKIFRIFKGLRYSKNFNLILRVIRSNRRSLATLLILAVFYVIVSALVMYNVEPESFDNYFDAVYWATTALTTVGYGDIYPVSVAGKAVSIISSFFGIAIVALPSGVITAGFMAELGKSEKIE